MDGAVSARKSSEEPVFSIGDLVAELGITHRTIRFYEDHGLLAPRRVGGNRIYSARDRARLKLVLRGKRLGFSLAEIAELLDLYDSDPQHREQLREALKKGRARIAELEQQRAALDETIAELREIEASIIRALEQADTEREIP
jgi:DNA-binding transcriptional MerR regulator